MKKRVLIYHTGGTFGMALGNTKTVQTQSPNFLKDLLEQVPELPSLAQIDLRILCNIDSSDANQNLWSLIANAIQENWDEFDGCVVIHGTDTMAFTATALAFFLQGLTKPIVFTGSQRPLSAMRSDARVNIIDAVELATRGIPEVMVCFDSKIHRAARVTKYSNEHLYAFKSYNAPLIGSLGVNFKIKRKIMRSVVPEAKRHMPIINTQINSNVASLICVPGSLPSDSFIDSLLNSIEGLIIQGFGSGNLPAADKNWLELCKKAFLKKIPVVMSTQCESGSVSLDLYENGRIFSNLGVISALDMTFEAASVKLMVMLGRNISFEKRHEFFSTPLAYECTPIFKNKEKIGANK